MTTVDCEILQIYFMSSNQLVIISTSFTVFSDSGETRTHNLKIRNFALYPVELQNRGFLIYFDIEKPASQLAVNLLLEV